MKFKTAIKYRVNVGLAIFNNELSQFFQVIDDSPTGTIEILTTSLVDEAKFPTSLFVDLYHQRWNIEEDHKVMKSRLNIKHFSGSSVEAILQDTHAKTLTKNLTSVAIIEVKRAKHNVQKYKY